MSCFASHALSCTPLQSFAFNEFVWFRRIYKPMVSDKTGEFMCWVTQIHYLGSIQWVMQNSTRHGTTQTRCHLCYAHATSQVNYLPWVDILVKWSTSDDGTRCTVYTCVKSAFKSSHQRTKFWICMSIPYFLGDFCGKKWAPSCQN